MKNAEKCPKCHGTKIESMDFSANVFLDFGTYYLGDLVIPRLYVCLKCGYSECWVDKTKDLKDIRKFAKAREEASGSAQEPRDKKRRK
jgi:predicted nucleic-acid-binding Zn-ribbon protein